MFVPSFLALWWPKIDRKSGFPQLFAKTVGSIHFIPGIDTYGVSLWTPIDFRVRALIFGPLVAKNWATIGVSATFRENCRLDSFHPWDWYLWGKSLDPYRFSCSCPHFWPSGGQKLSENRGFRNFSWKLSARFISSLGFILMGQVSGPLSIFVFVPSFLALWWPKIDRKSGFPQLFAKTVGSIHFIPGIDTYGVSLWTPIDFHVRALIFGPLVAKNWPKIGVSATFCENFFTFPKLFVSTAASIPSIPWHSSGQSCRNSSQTNFSWMILTSVATTMT